MRTQRPYLFIIWMAAGGAAAADLPQANDVELAFGAGFQQVDKSRNLNLNVQAGWFLDDRHQLGGAISYQQFRFEDGYSSRNAREGVGVFYRYNFISQSRSYFPYLGFGAKHYSSDWRADSDKNGFSANAKMADVHAGVKVMLMPSVALDYGVTVQRVSGEGNNDDIKLLHTGLSVFF